MAEGLHTRPRLICRDGEDREYFNDDFHGVGSRMPRGDTGHTPDETRHPHIRTYAYASSCATAYNYIWHSPQ